MNKNIVAIDTETTGLNPWTGDRMFATAAVFPSGRCLYWRDEFSGLRQVLEDEAIDKVFLNAKFDYRMLRYSGFTIKGKMWDVMTLGHLLDADQSLSLDSLSRKYLPPGRCKVITEIDDWMATHGIPKNQRGRHFEDLPPDILEKRCVGDATLTLLLFMRLFPAVDKNFHFLLDNETRLMPIVERMEDRGVPVDLDEVTRQMEDYTGMIDDVQQWCEGVLGADDFNIDSPTDQIELLKTAGILGDIRERTKTGRPKLDDKNLRALHHPVGHMLLVGRAAKKMRDTFLGQIERFNINGAIHPNYNQYGTTTGRFSCSKPNLMNIPIEGTRRAGLNAEEAEEAFEHTDIRYAPHIKRNFITRPGYAHIYSDKSRVELVMLAHYSEDQTLIDILVSGRDIHSEICKLLFGEETKGLRTRTKIIIFGYVFGAGDNKLAENMGAPVAEARKIRARLGAIAPGLPKLKERLSQEIMERGYIVTDHGRRHRLLPEDVYMCINRVCQGSAGDEVKTRMVAIGEFLASEFPECAILLNVHDDIGIEVPLEMVPKVAPHIHRLMHETSVPFRLPVPASMDITYTRWSDISAIEVKNGTYIIPQVPDHLNRPITKQPRPRRAKRKV